MAHGDNYSIFMMNEEPNGNRHCPRGWQLPCSRVLGELADDKRPCDFILIQNEDLEAAQILLAGPGAGGTT